MSFTTKYETSSTFTTTNTHLTYKLPLHTKSQCQHMKCTTEKFTFLIDYVLSYDIPVYNIQDLAHSSTP